MIPPQSDGRAIVPAKFLIVDDDGDSAATHALFLEESFGARVDLASDGPTALRHMAELGPYDLIISDIGLPGMDGLELIKAIRSLPDARSRKTPVIALTAFAEASMIAVIRRAGFEEWVAKPVAPEDLIAICLRHVPGLAKPGQET